ncbi:hypothetical protein FRB90_004293 [Tulasnella sp. 427]|nr:hypothetical protein FRB90_004293 [Tulasnella sp. 427]
MESIYLMTCYFVSRGFTPSPDQAALEVSTDFGIELPQLSELPQLEEHFLRRARNALVDSLSFSDRLVDFLRGSVLVTQYLYLRGRFLEGYHIHAGAAHLTLSCGLHRISTQVFSANDAVVGQFAGSPSAVLLPPPANELELAERITTFWMIYFCDKMSTICAGFLGALPGEGDAVEAITTVFPRALSEYESGAVNEIHTDTLSDLFGGLSTTTVERQSDIPWTVALKGPTSDAIITLQGLKQAIDRFSSTLSPAETGGPSGISFSEMPCREAGVLLGRTAALGALMEVHHTLLEATESEEQYEMRLANAVEVAELARNVKAGGLVHGTLICAGYCWALAARILVRHIESNDGAEPYAVDYESHLANLVTALETLSVTFPALRRGELKNLKLKKGALDRLRLPVDVAEGHLGRFVLEIPGTQILSSPCKITIEDLYLLVVPSAGRHHDPDEDEKRMQASKQERLESYETLQAQSAAATQLEGDEKSQAAVELAMTQRIADNLQVYVKNIHIRYEDDVSCPGHPFAAGITLGSFQVETTDKNWIQAFITEKLQSIELHKLAQLKSLSAYFDTDEKSISGLSVEDSKATFKSLISAEGRNPNHQYILRPVSGEARLIFNRRVTSTIPRFDASVTFDDLSFNLDDAQYRDAISMLDMYHFFTRQAQYRRFRPSAEEMQDNPKLAMLKFSVRAIKNEVHEKNEKWSPAFVVSRCQERHQYVALFKRKHSGTVLAGKDLEDFNSIEARLPYEDIRFYRSIAKAQLKKEKAAKAAAAPAKPANTGWFGGIGSYLYGSKNTANTASAPDPDTEEKQRKELYKAINYDESLGGDLPNEAMKLRVRAVLQKGSFALRRKPLPGEEGEKAVSQEEGDLISVVFESSRVELIQRPENLETALTLGGFNVFDGTLPGTKHPKIVRVKEGTGLYTIQNEPAMGVETISPAGDNPDDEGKRAVDNALLYVKFIQNPLDKHSDSALTVRLRALEIVYHKGYVETVVAFFRPPESQLESVTALLSAASETLGEIRNQSRAGLEYALQKHKTIDIELDMQAPIIIIPEDVRSQSGQHMVLDAGHISVRSDLVPKSEILAIQAKRKRQYTDKDYEELESLMYDKFFLQLQSAQLVLGKDLDTCLTALNLSDGGKELHLLEQINMEFSVQTSIIPDAPNLTRFKVAGTLPSLNVNFSNTKYKGIMRFVDISIPNFDGDAKGKSQPRPTTTPAVTSATRPDPFQLPSNFFRSTNQYLIDDADRSTIGGDDESDAGETFVDADNGSMELSRSTIKQNTFEFSFKVETLQASLYKDENNGTPEKLLAELQLHRFDLDFALAKFDMKVDLSLNSLSVHMLDQPGHRVPMIMSSRDDTSVGTEGHTEGDDLVKVKYVRVQQNSPEFLTVYEGVDQSVSASLSTLVVHAAPEPIIVLYDFIMSTFVPGHGGSEANTPVAANTPIGDEVSPGTPNSSKIRVKVNLTTVEVLLIDNDRRLATLDLSAAEVGIFLRGNTMRIGGHLGNLSIVDESPLTVENGDFKKIVSIEGDQLADFTYETFDPSEKETFPGVNSLVHLRFASLKVTFIEGPVRDIYQWLIKFARMKALYDAATQAAVQRASEITRMKFDIVVKSPILVIPRDASNSSDVLVMKLGEIFANNSYTGPVATTSAGLRGIRLTSHFHYGDDVANLRMIDDVEVSTKIVQTENIDRSQNLQEPDTVTDVNISDIKLALTQSQYILLMQLLQAIPRVLAAAPGAEKAAEESSIAPAHPPPVPAVDDSEPKVDLTPELGMTAHTESGQDVHLWSSLDVAINVKAIRLQLFDHRATLETTLKESGIVRCSLTDSEVKFKMLSDGATQTEVTLKSFTINNTRAGTSRFREIIPAAQHNRNQFTVLYSTAGGSDPSATAIVLIDSPKVLFTVEPVFALLAFFQSPFTQAQQKSADSDSSTIPDEQESAPKQSTLSVRLDMHDVSVTLLERDDDLNTQAIQLTIKEINLAQQSITSLAVKKMGMCLMSMNKPADKVSFLDEIDVTLTIDGRQTTDHQMTEIGLNVLPIVFRASLRDISLITAIVNRALELSSSQASSPPKAPKPVSARPTSTVSRKSAAPSRPKASQKSKSRVIMSKELLNAKLDGFRMVLIGDLHELPLLHLNTTAIAVRASDWSSELQATASLTTSITYWNLTNSHWEPLIDPWPLSLSAHKDSITGALTLGLASQERLDLNLTTTFIDLALSTATIWSKEGERLMKKARGGDAPYKIFNRTGAALQVWSDVDDKSKGGSQAQSVQLEDGASIEWRFDDWRTMRDRVSSSSRTNSIAVQFQNKSWDAIRAIPVDREGEFVYALRPRTQKTADRLLCEVTVKENVKHVTLRSTYKLENSTLYPIDVVLIDNKGRPSHSLKKLSPGEDYIVPIEAVLLSDIQVRPDPGFGYSWAERPIKWHDLVSDPAQTITCPYKEGGGEFPFRFQAWASYDPNDSINRTYPKMTIRLRAPIELENLLPFDFKYRIYDTTSRRTWTSYLRRGGLMPIHCVHLDQCVMFSAEIQETNYKPSDFSVINSDGSPDIPVESVLRVEDKQDRRLDLRINYTKYEESGGAFRMQIYSPFVALNKTGFPLNIKCRNGKPVAGQVENPETTPFMFSHTKEQGAEFLFRLGDTAWSNALNFEAPSAETAVALGSSVPSSKETHIGVSWTSGLGKYRLTKVVTFAPRFVLKNELDQDIVFRESGDPANDSPLRAGNSSPIFALSARREAALAFKYPGVDSKWSPPANLQDLGVVHVKIPTTDEDNPDLARVEVALGGPTIWITLKHEKGPWPFRIENASDYQVQFYQKDAPMSPKYKLEPHSQSRYAWDYPAARQKELVLRMGVGEESVNLNEIGDLLPFRFKTSSGWKVVSRDIHAEDDVTVLTLSNWVEETSVYKRHGRSATMDSTISRADTVSSQSPDVGFTAVVKDISPSMVVKVDFDGIGLSLMNRRLVEVVYLTLSKLQITYTDSEIARDIDLTCGWVQIDNQLHEALYPIVLQPLLLTQDRDAKTVWNTVETKLTLVKDEAHGVVFIKYFGILLQALSIQTDEDFLFALLDLTKIKGASWEKDEIDAFAEYPKDLAPPRPIERGTTLYFEELDLNPIRLALSFARTERVNADEKLTLRNPLTVIVNALAMTLGNVNDAPLKLNGLLLRDTLLTVPGLQERIIYHYKNEVLRQVYRILGSADFIGNPVGLFTNVASGVADIITEPWQSVLNHGSKELGIGIAKGAASFAKKTVFSVSDSLTKVTGSVGKGFANATFDAEFQRQRRLAQRRNRPGNAIYGVQSGGEALVTSFASGLEGIVSKPLEGAERDGAVGFFKGIGKGFVGAFTKPAVGIFDLASNLAEGVRNTTTVFDNNNQSRKRIPRHTPADGILTPYSQREAVGQAWMKDLNNGAYRAEFYHAHLAIPGSDVVVMLTSGHVLGFYSTKLRLKWEVPLAHIQKVSTSETGILFSNKAGREYDQFVQIPAKDSRDWFFKEIDKYVEQLLSNGMPVAELKSHNAVSRITSHIL